MDEIRKKESIAARKDALEAIGLNTDGLTEKGIATKFDTVAKAVNEANLKILALTFQEMGDMFKKMTSGPS